MKFVADLVLLEEVDQPGMRRVPRILGAARSEVAAGFEYSVNLRPLRQQGGTGASACSKPEGFYFSRKLLVTTVTLESAMAADAIMGESRPSAAMGIPTAL